MTGFQATMDRIDPGLLQLERLDTLQVNLGNRCNLQCAHCHVQAGPEGTRVMPRPVMEQIIHFLAQHPGLCLDMTGGCPELNPDYRFFCEAARPLVVRMMARTNLTVLLEPGLEWVGPWYRDNKVVVIGSLPCYTQQNVDSQRGRDVFRRCIEAIGTLNRLGYGRDNELELDLVYNPGGDFLPGSQEELEAAYRKHLGDEFGLVFTKLFTITNAPIGRFRSWLDANGALRRYKTLLEASFNPAAAVHIMCRGLVSVDYRGIVYNCDFNQALDLPLVDARGLVVTIATLEQALEGPVRIITAEHCFCCTAGAGSSCTGELAR